MATYARVVVLLWADILAVYALWLLMAYLTDVWELEITHAATIVAIFWGLVALFPLLQTFIADTVTGNFSMLHVTNVTFSVGLGLLAMSTPPVLARITENCGEYKPECIGQAQKVLLLYTALPLIAFGLAGHSSCCTAYIVERATNGIHIFDGRYYLRLFVNSRIPRIVLTLVAVLGLPYINPWSLRFGIPAISTLVATLMFFSTLSSYKNNSGPEGSPLTTFIRVFVAAASKMFHRMPKDPKQLFEFTYYRFGDLTPHTRTLRCLDKAAIVIPTKPRDEQRDNRWGLCKVTEVEETKTIIRTIPVWTTFVLCGVVSSIGFTFFIEQLNHMNPKVGRLKVPIVVIIWFYQRAKAICDDQFVVQVINLIGKSLWKKLGPTFGIAISMILGILCCVTAAKVESRRLGVVQEHGLVDKPDETVPMTMFWLLPQFLLLGAFDGLLRGGVFDFFMFQWPVSTRGYLKPFISGASGVGILGSILSVFVVGKISEKGGEMNWFQHDLNRSRLDKYYWTLASLMAANLVVFVVVAVFYIHEEVRFLKDRQAARSGGVHESNDDDNAQCFCCF